MTTLSQIEALLFVAGEEGLSIRQLAELLELPPSGLQQSMEKLVEKYENDKDSALTILESANTYKLVTKEYYAELLKSYAHTPVNQSLSRASLETLSIIAYKSPLLVLRLMRFVGLIQVGLSANCRPLAWFQRLERRKFLDAQIYMRQQITF